MAPPKPRDPEADAEERRRRVEGSDAEEGSPEDHLGPDVAHAVDEARRAHLHGFLGPEEERDNRKP
jgi:hypothetical protein